MLRLIAASKDRSHNSYNNYKLIKKLIKECLSLTGADSSRYIATPRLATGRESVQTLQLKPQAQLAEKQQAKNI